MLMKYGQQTLYNLHVLLAPLLDCQVLHSLYHEIFAFCARATGKTFLPVVATTFVCNEVSVATKSSGDTRFCVKGLIREQARKRRVKLLSPLLFSATAIHHLP